MLKKMYVGEGVGIGANATTIRGLRIGKYRMIGAGSVGTWNVADYSLVYGNGRPLRGGQNC